MTVGELAHASKITERLTCVEQLIDSGPLVTGRRVPLDYPILKRSAAQGRIFVDRKKLADLQ
jgi:hypothetical protein